MDASSIKTGKDARDYADEQLTDKLLEEHDSKNRGSNDQQSEGDGITNAN